MKKSLIALSVAAALCSTSVVMAASDPFSDVPAKHWAYDAVSKLAQSGIISGQNNAFQGDRTLTRYEMATIVANAMTKTDKADAETKALVDKLINEFSDELKGLGKRLAAVEKKTPLTIHGFAKYRYEYTKNPRPLAEDVGYLSAPSHYGRADSKSNSRMAMGLLLNNDFDGDTYFHGMLIMETLGGRTTDTDLEVKEAFFAKKIGPNAELAAGRFLSDVGLGTLGGAPYMDGGKISFGKDVKVKLYSTKFGGEGLMFVNPQTHQPITNPQLTPIKMPGYTFNHGDVKFNLTKDLKMSVAYFADTDKSVYNSQAVGVEYKGVPGITLTGEYGKNSGDSAKLATGTLGANGLVPGDAPTAYYIKAKYKGANPFVPDTSGFWVQYKKAEAGFDLMGMAEPRTWNSPFNHTSPSGGGMAENIKGFEYGFETTVAKRMVFNMTYNDLKRVSSSVISLANAKDQSYFTTQLTYLF
ncbi:S-layer homology domain-containing protein [Sporomusa sp.]|uniref:S-layer homology domain-containing protein n=1 Tax=Sporomusa sp. TaxID=2078658 RepID=UPI002B551BB2|nr:S-layer homology domain-containing protein [Sporomusa sp.]HWR45498.1 S-layer homology domain-containing protein [Sporomusa sp.]